MDLVSLIVLGSAAIATLWLVIYVGIILPRQVDERFFDSMRAFSRAVELRFPGHTGLTDDVEMLATRLAKELKFNREQLRRLKMAARLQDIGLCALPYSLINKKASSRWTSAEKATYERHPDVSGAMLDLVPSLRDLTDIVRHHHTRFDSAPALPLEARVLKVSVEYAWTSRTDGEALAQQRVLQSSGSEFCPEVVSALAVVLGQPAGELSVA